ncbi:MAG: preprotein translocase subunit YajC [Bacteroidales bacterium]|nr:preprotein translocase subunit YajC [Bacteroidales bacterium]
MLLLDISNSWKTVIMMILMAVVFYFFLIRPQRQQQKKERAYRDSLKKGDLVMTAGGIHGTVFSTAPGYVSLEIAPGKIIKVQKSGVMPIPELKRK